jgi:hypothetical protein
MRSAGNSLAEIAEATETTVAVVRRIVGPADRAGVARRLEEVAVRIDGLDLPWKGKVRQWTEETRLCGTTFWRVLQRIKR